MVLVRTATVALVGNPNTGKTTLFNALAGMRQRVGNYPGVTVETKKGHMTCGGQPFDLIDLPGTYSLAPRSPDEMVAVDLILGHQEGEPKPDVVLSIVDASNLERNLYLTTQVLELGVPVVIALNMIDVAEGQGIRIDAEKLSRQLSIRVVPIQANKGRGLDQLKQAVAAAAEDEKPPEIRPEKENGIPSAPVFPEAFEREVQSLRKELGDEIEAFLVRRLLLDVGGYTETKLGRQHRSLGSLLPAARERLATANCPVPAVEARVRYAWIRQATGGCVMRPDKRPVTWTDWLDRLLTHKLMGSAVFLLLMFLVFQSIFLWARPLMKLIGTGADLLSDLLRGWLPAGPLTSLLLDGGLQGVGAVVVFLPQILILFLFIAILEDCGYMARAAFLMDRLMARAGLSGKSFIPMLSSVACAVPGIMATRVIENRRDRLATILVAPLMSCSARLPVYILLIAAFLTTGYPWWLPGVVMFGMYMIGIVVAPLVALLLKRTLLRGETPVFVMEMPMYKVPSLRTVARRVFDSGWAFVRRAGTLILASMIVVWALLYFPRTEPAEKAQAYLADRDADLAGMREEAREAQGEEKDSLEKEIAATQKEIAEIQQNGLTYDVHVDRLQKDLEELQKLQPDKQDVRVITSVAPDAGLAGVPWLALALCSAKDKKQDEVNEVHGEWKRQSLLGQMGRGIEPVVRPLGWDWKIGMAALASFPAREVVVGTLGIIYNQGKVDTDEIREARNAAETKLGQALQEATWDDDPQRKVYTVPVALSLMVFFALCCQCASTLAVIRRETRTWRWPVFAFVYMTVLAYIGALVVYQVGSLF